MFSVVCYIETDSRNRYLSVYRGSPQSGASHVRRKEFKNILIGFLKSNEYIIKNHPFTDGNKRSGVFSFVWFLQKFSLIDVKKIDPQTLAALTILIAESDPKDKDKMVGLVMMLLGNARKKEV